MSFAPNSPAPTEDQNRLLDEVLNVVKVQAHQMKKCLVLILILSELGACAFDWLIARL